MNKYSSVYIPDEEVYTQCPYDKRIKQCRNPHDCDRCEVKDDYDKEQEEKNESNSLD